MDVFTRRNETFLFCFACISCLIFTFFWGGGVLVLYMCVFVFSCCFAVCLILYLRMFYCFFIIIFLGNAGYIKLEQCSILLSKHSRTHDNSFIKISSQNSTG